MPDVQEVFRMATQKVDQDPGALERQVSRQRRRARNRKIGALGLVAALGVALIAFALATIPDRSPTPAASVTQVPLNTTPPIGVQIVTLDGRARQQIPGIPTDTPAVQLSPDGNTIAFFDATGEVATSRTDGTDPRVLTSGLVDDVGDAENGIAWSPAGTKIAYTASNEIYVMNADGSDQRRLTHSPVGGGSYQPAWSSDGGTIAYWRTAATTGEDGGPTDAEIYTIPATGGQTTRLTFDHVPSIAPSWQQPAGDRIVYRKSRDQELWIMRNDGKDAGRVSPDLINPWSPVWSDDGSSIAFLSCCANRLSDTGIPLLEVQVLLGTGRIKHLHIYVAGDIPGPQWISNDTLLINRYN